MLSKKKILTMHPGQHLLAVFDRVLVLMSDLIDLAIVTAASAPLLAGLLDCYHRRCKAAFRVDRYRCIEGRCLHQIMFAKTKVTKTKTALKQETYNLSDLKHDLHCGFVELGGSVSVSS